MDVDRPNPEERIEIRIPSSTYSQSREDKKEKAQTV